MARPDVVVLDLDRTICRFPATTRIYKRLLLAPPASPKYLAWGAVMLFLMHVLWFVGPAVRLQRRIVMSLLSRVPPERFTACVEEVAAEVVEDWHEGLGRRIASLFESAEATYLLSHCPQHLGERVATALELTGAHTVPVADYLRGAPGDIYDKTATLEALRQRHPDAAFHVFADDLVDLPILRAAEVGVLINGSWWSRTVCKLFFPRIRIWT